MGNRHEDPETGQAGPDTSWLTGLLDTEAGRYAPDGRRLRAAVHQRIRGRHREYAPIRPSRATTGIVSAVLAAAAAVAVTATVETRQAPVALPSAAASGRPSAASRTPATGPPGQADGGARQSTVGVRPAPTAPASSSSAPSAGTGASLLSATGTNDLGAFPYWIQEELSVSLRAPVTALRLTVTVTRTAEVASTGYWTTDDPAVFDVTVAAQAGTLTYTFTLKPGQTLPAGNSAFAVQFDHGTDPHDPAADSYALSVTSDEQNEAVQGTADGSF